jgi:hypothetical protein
MRSNHELNVNKDFGELLGVVRQMLASALTGPSFGRHLWFSSRRRMPTMAMPRASSSAESF